MFSGQKDGNRYVLRWPWLIPWSSTISSTSLYSKFIDKYYNHREIIKIVKNKSKIINYVN
jgi:hypothetical protein